MHVSVYMSKERKQKTTQSAHIMLIYCCHLVLCRSCTRPSPGCLLSKSRDEVGVFAGAGIVVMSFRRCIVRNIGACPSCVMPEPFYAVFIRFRSHETFLHRQIHVLPIVIYYQFEASRGVANMFPEASTTHRQGPRTFGNICVCSTTSITVTLMTSTKSRRTCSPNIR